MPASLVILDMEDFSGMMPTVRSRLVRSIAPATICRLTLAAFVFAAMALAADARLLSMLPAKSEAVGGVNVKAVLNSGLAQEFMKSPGADAAGLAELTALTGVDIKSDIDELVFAGYTRPAANGTVAPGTSIGVGFITGTFDPARIGGAIVSKGGTKQAYKSYTLYKPAAAANKDGDVIAFLDGSTMVAGNPAQVKQVLDKTQGGLPAGMLSRVNEVSGRYDLWMVSAVSPAAMAGSLSGAGASGEPGPGAMAGDLFKKVESTQGGIKLGPTINIGLEVISTSPEDAAALMNMLGFFRSMIGSQPPTKEGRPGPPAGLVNMMNAIKMRTDAKTLFVTMDVPESDVISFLHTAQKRAAESKAKGPEEIIVIQ